MAFIPAQPYNDLPKLPPQVVWTDTALLRSVAFANRKLGELKGYCQTLPNAELLLDTLFLQESRASSEIENIVTTQDELYQALATRDTVPVSPSVKEVLHYRDAIDWAHEQIQNRPLLTTNLFIGVMQKLRGTNEEVRKHDGVYIGNPVTREVVYTPPAGETLIRDLLHNLEVYLNTEEDGETWVDPLIRMAVAHYQFEAIHPFSDGNGRTGRILNVLFLVQQGLLDRPILYLSRYIIEHKTDYYRLLRGVTERSEWLPWVHFMVSAVEETAVGTLSLIREINTLREQMKDESRKALPGIGPDLIDLAFQQPYCKIAFVVQKGLAQRVTASRYLQKLEEAGLLTSVPIGREKYFVNTRLIQLLTRN